VVDDLLVSFDHRGAARYTEERLKTRDVIGCCCALTLCNSFSSVVDDVLVYFDHRGHRGASRYTEERFKILVVVLTLCNSFSSVVDDVLVYFDHRGHRGASHYTEERLKTRDAICCALTLWWMMF
jgi:hypothetical protein